MWSSRLSFLLLFLLGTALAARPKTLMLVGGALDDANQVRTPLEDLARRQPCWVSHRLPFSLPQEVYDLIIAHAGGPTANLCVVATAGDDPCCDPDSSWPYYRDMFTRYGAQRITYVRVCICVWDRVSLGHFHCVLFIQVPQRHGSVQQRL